MIDLLADPAHHSFSGRVAVIGGGVGTAGAGAGGYCYRAGYAFSFLVGDQLAQALYVNERLRCRA